MPEALPGAVQSRTDFVQRCVSLPHSVSRTLQRSERVACQGRGGDRVMVIADGGAALRLAGPQPRRGVLEVLGPGRMVSALSPTFPQGPTTHCELEALEPTRVISIGREAFRGELRRDPDFAIAMADALHHQHAALVTRLSAMQLLGPEERTAATVAGLAREFVHRCPLSTGFTMPVSQQLVADLTGLSRQTVNRALTRLRLARLVFSSRGFICALDLAGLDAVAWAGVPLATCTPVGWCKLLQPDQRLDCNSAGRMRARTPSNR